MTTTLPIVSGEEQSKVQRTAERQEAQPVVILRRRSYSLENGGISKEK